MAKTIKEMAENSGYPTLAEKAAYWDGANAVLSEIEQAIKGCDVDGSPYAAVLDKIKELKGESV